MKTLKIGRAIVKPGQRRRVEIPLTETYLGTGLAMPVTVLRALRPGPVVLVTAAVHGDELNGIEVVRELDEEVRVEALRRGALVLAPILNVPAFLAGSRYLPDRRDLNRSFPGSRHGSLASRIANRILRSLVLKADYVIDLHTASTERTNLPHVRGDLRDARVRRVARAFGSEVVVHKPASRRTLRGAAMKAGVAAILFEAGEANLFQRDMVQRGLNGVRNVLRALRMLEGKPARPQYRVIVKRAMWVRARKGGILDIRVRPGDVVYRGDTIAITTFPFGHERDVIQAPATGMVLGVHRLPLANPGNAICHLVRLAKTLKTVERALGMAETEAPATEAVAAAAAAAAGGPGEGGAAGGAGGGSKEEAGATAAAAAGAGAQARGEDEAATAGEDGAEAGRTAGGRGAGGAAPGPGGDGADAGVGGSRGPGRDPHSASPRTDATDA